MVWSAEESGAAAANGVECRVGLRLQMVWSVEESDIYTKPKLRRWA